MYREKGRSTGPDIRAEEMYILLCSIFCTWKHNRKTLLNRRSMADLHSSWATRSDRGGKGDKCKYRSIPSPLTSEAFMFFYKGNQVNIIVKESLDREAELGNHSLRIAYNVYKVRRAAFFNLPCAGELLKWTPGYFNISYWSHPLPLPLASSLNHNPTSSLCSHSKWLQWFYPALLLICSKILGGRQQYAVLVELLWEKVSSVYQTRTHHSFLIQCFLKLLCLVIK